MSLQKICLDESGPSEGDLTSSDEDTRDTSASINNQDQTRVIPCQINQTI